jgi:cephalosporin hydroxylase
MVFLDSYHTHEHVKKEISIYGPLVTVGSYLVVFDTFMEDLPPEASDPYYWSVGDNPKTAVLEFLSDTDEFETDSFIDSKLQITHARGGFLKRIKSTVATG